MTDKKPPSAEVAGSAGKKRTSKETIDTALFPRTLTFFIQRAVANDSFKNEPADPSVSPKDIEEATNALCFYVEQWFIVRETIASLQSTPIAGLPEFEKELALELQDAEKQIVSLTKNARVVEGYNAIHDARRSALRTVIENERDHQLLRRIKAQAKPHHALARRLGIGMNAISREHLEKQEQFKKEVEARLQAFQRKLQDKSVSEMYALRERNRLREEMTKWGFAETESRTKIIEDILPHILSDDGTLGNGVVLVQGETSTGKTLIVDYACRRYLGVKAELLSMNPDINRGDFQGKDALNAGSTEFSASTFLESLDKGIPVILDELDRATDEAISVIYEFIRHKKIKVEGREYVMRAPLFLTANIASKRYKNRSRLDPAFLQRVDVAKRVDYLDFGQTKDGVLIAPETMQVLSTFTTTPRGSLDWGMGDPEKCDADLKKFVRACRHVQEDFTLSQHTDDVSGKGATGRVSLKDMTIGIADQIKIIKAWMDMSYTVSLENVFVQEYILKRQFGATTDKDLKNILQVFMLTGGFKFQGLTAGDFGILGLTDDEIDQWRSLSDA